MDGRSIDVPAVYRDWLVTTHVAHQRLLVELFDENPVDVAAFAFALGYEPDPRAGHNGELRVITPDDGERFVIWAPGPPDPVADLQALNEARPSSLLREVP